MSEAVTLVRFLRGAVASSGPDCSSSFRDMVCSRLDDIEAAILDVASKPKAESLSAKALIALADLGEGTTPMQLGQVLDPSKDGYHAGSIGGARLSALKKAGLVRRTHFGWWVLTEAGRREAERLRAAQSHPRGGQADV